MILLMKFIKQLICTLLGILLSFTALAAPCDEETAAVATTSKNDKPAAEYLEFEAVLDGKCQNLSAGGKLMLVKNNHPSKKIYYRFNRIFSGKRQASVAQGILEPGGKPKKLGCTKVDKREQHWEIKIAEFTE